MRGRTSRRRTARKRTIIGASLVAILAVILGLLAYSTLTADQSGEQASDPPAETTEQESAASGNAESGNAEETTAGEQAGTVVEEQTAPEETSVAEVPPEETLALYYDYQNVYAWAEAYELLSERSKERVTSEQYVEYWTAAPDFTIFYSFSDVQVQGDGATVVVEGTIVMGEEEETNERVQAMVLEDGTWRVVLSEGRIAAFTGAE